MIGHNRGALILGVLSAALLGGACGGDSDETGDDSTGSGTGASTSTEGGGTATSDTQSPPRTNDGDNDTTEDGSMDDPDTASGDEDPDSTGEPGPVQCDFTESFDGVRDGGAWPAPWVMTGGVEVADVQGGRGRLRPVTSGYSLARMFAPMDCTDFEATFTFEFTDGGTQGAGFYVRQNGGHLMLSQPTGRGYSVFAEAFRDPVGLGVWREVGGAEENLAPVEPMTIAPNVRYAVRLRVAQLDAATTQLQAKMWAADAEEPAGWQVERTDAGPDLQGARGGVAIDAWSVLTAGEASDMFFDDIVVTAAS